MSILHNVYQGFSSAVNLVVEKNRKNNLINRIKYVIREENEETEFYCKAVEHANNRIDRALTKLDELTIDAEDFFCDEDFESACEDLGFASCENAEEASSWDYTETINNEMIAEKEISAEDTLNSSDFPSDEEIVKNICDVHGSCGEDYKKESSESEAASEEENQIPIIKDNHIHPFGDTEK